MITLGIETSCDETALALIETLEGANGLEVRIISSLVHSQAKLHSAFGGVYPSLAKREHGKNIVPLLNRLLDELDDNKGGKEAASKEVRKAHFNLAELATEFEKQNIDLAESIRGAEFLLNIPEIDQIAVTEGPGLEPALWVGINFANFLGKIWSVKVIPVNHMEGHIVGSLLESADKVGEWQKLIQPKLPAIALLVSGGHTELVEIKGLGKYKVLGQTVDDAVGEAYDKVARLLGLPYPGGPEVSKLSQKARELDVKADFKLPRPMLQSHDLNFSYSGLKTAVLYTIRKITGSDNPDPKTIDEKTKMALCREFEDAVIETLTSKLRSGIDQIQAKSIIIGGGVSANTLLKEKLKSLAEEYGLEIYLPHSSVSGDNALMIALAGALDKSEARTITAHSTKKL